MIAIEVSPQQVWGETEARCKVEEWCLELGWHYAAGAWYCDVHMPTGEKVQARHFSMGGVSFIELLFPFSEDPVRPVEPHILLFLLRRNASLGRMQWCITRHDGVAVRSAYELKALTATTFGAIAMGLIQEFRTLDELARATPIESFDPLVVQAGK